MTWEAVIGLEVHCQLETKSKLFSPCPVEIGAAPNTRTDPYSWGMPGTLPVPNEAAVRFAIALALATECHIAPRSRFARKHYFYPDLPKGYQITQADEPYAVGGVIEVPGAVAPGDGGPVRVRLTRIHLEEDAGKNIHAGGRSLVDYNRAGAPLVEIVSEPDLRSAEHAAAYVRELRTIVRALGISRANMEEGTLRCDANVSLRRRGTDELGVRCEIKNVNSFRFLARAIESEIRRQADLLDAGQPVVRATLGYDGERDRLRIMRTKEDAADYRYLPDPDLPPLAIPDAWVAEVRASMPELPAARRARWIADGVASADAFLLASERELADWFDAVVAAAGRARAKRAASWVVVELLGRLETGRSIADAPVAPGELAELVVLVDDGTISGRTAKDVFGRMWAGEGSPRAIVEREGLGQVSDTKVIEAAIAEVLAANPQQLAQLRAGKEALRGFFIGQVMKRTRGQANPALVGALLDAALRADAGDA
ncbi:MAG TPA: Asp-tRNA(Asn)/Glu-tRNA(Gln) amidotransferase subunit GatB [Nannocystaceae bacterium]|nr:Asp-tRNA(Asn)/Glu-tRNA(Gln) amidotransferase subunit GatB [Nannocystaceae bacterium]